MSEIDSTLQQIHMRNELAIRLTKVSKEETEIIKRLIHHYQKQNMT